jgi:hypothetical protein
MGAFILWGFILMVAYPLSFITMLTIGVIVYSVYFTIMTSVSVVENGFQNSAWRISHDILRCVALLTFATVCGCLLVLIHEHNEARLEQAELELSASLVLLSP